MAAQPFALAVPDEAIADLRERVNLVGETSTAKTLLLKLAASVQGNIDNGAIPTLDSTAAALEQLVIGFRDSFLLLDEIGQVEGSEKQIAQYLRSFAFRLASGRSKGRAGQYEEAVGLPNLASRNIVGMTTERSIADINKTARGRRLPGEAVRLIELPASREGQADVFDRPKANSIIGPAVRDRGAYIERLEQLLNDEQGTAASEFLRRLVGDERAKRRLTKYADEFMDEVKDCLTTPAEGRLARHIAIAAAAARLAIQYDVLPWNLKNTYRDLKVCLIDALTWIRKEKPAASTMTDQELLSNFLGALARLDTLDLHARKKSSVSAMEVEQHQAFRRTFNDDQVPTLLVKSSWMKRSFPSTVRQRLCALCINRNIMSEGRPRDTHTYQEKIGGELIEVYRLKGV